MNSSKLKEQLQAQIIDTEHLLSLVKGHPLMAYGLEEKIAELKSELANIPEFWTEPKVRLLFSGKAVMGSKGIKAKFVTEALKPFQELVKTQTAILRYGKVGKRGKSRNSKISDLYLTALPKGSFGVELAQMGSEDIFAGEEVAIAIDQVMSLVEAAVKDDESFEAILEDTPARNLNNLKIFLKKIDEEKSILKMESGSSRITINEDSIHKGYERVNAASKEDIEIFENGILRGVMLETGRFEFINEDHFKYSGIISPKISEETLNLYWNETCHVHLKKSRIKFISGNEKVTYELLEVSERKNEAPK